MVKCSECPKLDKELEVCSLKPSEITDEICLLRHICYAINGVYSILEEEHDSGEEWKYT